MGLPARAAAPEQRPALLSGRDACQEDAEWECVEVDCPPGEDCYELEAANEQPEEPDYKSPGAAAALSVIFPGVGHFYLRDGATAGSLMGMGGAALTASAVTLLDGWPRNRTDPTFLLSSMALQNSWLYGIYAAYRDGRHLRSNHGYDLAAPSGELDQLAFAPFNLEVLLQPEVGLGILVWTAVGVVVSHIAEPLFPARHSIFRHRRLRFLGQSMHAAGAAVLGELYYTGLFVPVGIGEEAFFRGFLQSSLSESLGPWAGWAAASLVFGLIHAPNALMFETSRERQRYLILALPTITAGGAYLGWVYMSNNYSLRESVAIHFWYDLLLASVSFAVDTKAQPFIFQFSLPL